MANYFERRVAFETKGEFDLVTEADRASERLVVERLRMDETGGSPIPDGRVDVGAGQIATLRLT